jgi:hypothetical protein
MKALVGAEIEKVARKVWAYVYFAKYADNLGKKGTCKENNLKNSDKRSRGWQR